MNKVDRIRKLVELLNRASDAYYNSGHTIMTDYEFDTLMDELRALEQSNNIVLSNSPTHNIGSETKIQLNKVTHTRPMLSLDKCHSAKELIDFAGNDNCYLSVKCDGLTTRLTYSNGKLVGAETRGDGVIGVDVLFHIKNYINVPTTIPYKDKFVIDGESVIFSSDFEKINANLSDDEKFANARNLASGTLNNLDSNITKQRRMRFIAWRVIEGIDCDSNFLRLRKAEEYGFDIAPMYAYMSLKYTESDTEELLHLLKNKANDMGLPMDGIVMAKDSEKLAMSMGRTEKFFRHSIAYKFEDEKYETKLKYIDWTLGKSGILTPTAVFSPVEIDGSIVERASLHNISIIKSLGLTNHCTVRVFKANCIIPQIDGCLSDGDGEIEIPSTCPICGKTTAIQKDNESEVLICTNPDCSGKLLGRFTHFVSKKAMNIDGLSEATLNLLISNNYISKFVDIYHLSEHANELAKLPGLGAKSVQKLIASIEKSREVKLENFITALGIPNIGSSAAKTISNYFNGDYTTWIQAYRDCFEWTVLDDFGIVMAASLERYLDENFDMVQELASEMNFIVEEKKSITNDFISGKTFCVTGAFNTMKRSEIEKIITERGGKLSSSVSKKTDYLLTNDSDSGSTKARKAAELNVPIMDEVTFIKMIGE